MRFHILRWTIIRRGHLSIFPQDKVFFGSPTAIFHQLSKFVSNIEVEPTEKQCGATYTTPLMF